MSVRMLWGVKIPLRDGVNLNATLYLPEESSPRPVIFTLTPYIGQTYHDYAMYFAAHGLPFLTVDVRGRGNSEGTFRPFIQEAPDGYDIVEWLARQPYSNEQVAMWGGSYSGFNQWTTAKERPPHLATIVPVASPCMGVDFPMRNNIPLPYLIQWLTLVAGRTSQDKLFWNNERQWGEKFSDAFKRGYPFRNLDAELGLPSATFQEWLDHPLQDAYWDAHNPTPDDYQRINLPILTITGIYDGDQPGALAHYHRHLQHAPPATRAQHHLIIGPWDHAGTRAPQTEFVGLKVAAASLIDLPKLHLEWYLWVLQGGPKPTFLQKRVAYYVMGAEYWRYADELTDATADHQPLYLSSTTNPTDIYHSGTLVDSPTNAEPVEYVYDPHDVRHADLESTVDPESRTDQRMVHTLIGQQLVYHTVPFATNLEITGFFKLSAWLSIDQPDTDIRATLFEIDLSGRSILLTADWLRARHRTDLRHPTLITTTEPLRYDFHRFTFVSRLIPAGHRLRLVIGPINSIYHQKNYNSGATVSDETLADARPVTVKLHQREPQSSVLFVPIGRT